jgi:acetylornithine/succinyldiaminopimelate/putrescine aminotransferase
MARLDQIADLERRFLLPTYNRYPVAFERGKGVFLYDFEGKKYLDFVAGLGVNALGHAHPRIVKTIREQAAKLIHISNLYYNEYQGRLAERLCQLSGLDRRVRIMGGRLARCRLPARRNTARVSSRCWKT